MEMNLVNMVSIVAAFVSFLFIIFLLSIRTERSLPNYALAIYLFGFMLDTLSQFNTTYLYPISPIAGMLISLSVFFVLPALYLFVKSSIYRDFKLSAVCLVHLIPYFGVTVILLPVYFLVHVRGEFSPEYASEFTSSLSIKSIYLLLYIQIAFYFTFIFIILRRYRQLLVENYSNPNKGNYRWLMQFTVLILAMNIIGLIRNIMRFSSSEDIFNYATLFVVINILIFISWVLIKSLKEPGMFTGIYSDIQLVKKIVKESGVPKGDGLDDADGRDTDELTQKIVSLRDHMEQNEPFLDSSLSVYELAKQLDMNVRELSLLINHTLNQHFFDFVNHYRIEKAMEILRDPENKKITFLEVLYEVGFNSKSSFNTVFKKQTGLTPTQFRRAN